MDRTANPAGWRTSLLALPALVAIFYMSCVVYRLVLHALLSASMLLAIIFNAGAGKSRGPDGLMSAFQTMRDSSAGMTVAAAIVSVITARWWWQRRAMPRSWVGPCFMLVASVGLAAADLRYGISAINDLPHVAAMRRPGAPAPSLRMTVEQIVRITRRPEIGSMVEVDGVLGCNAAMQRLELHGLTGEDERIYLFVSRGRTRLIDNPNEDATRAAIVNELRPLLGQPIHVTGQAFNGALHADIGDVRRIDLQLADPAKHLSLPAIAR